MAVGFFGKLLHGGSKVLKTINKVDPKVNKTKLDKLKSEFAIARQERKGAEAKLKQTKFEIENPNFAKGKFTFKKDKGKSESNREAYKRIQKENTKAKGGRVGLRLGSKKSNVEKIKKTFGPKSLGMQSVIYGLDKNPKITAADPKAKFIAAANKKKNKKVI